LAKDRQNLRQFNPIPMTPITLKTYQQSALDTLAGFARTARLQGAAQAFASLAGRPYQADAFGEVPCVCLRVPTGGGKTVLAAHAVPLLARAWAAVDAPVALWLVPSDAIRTQTLKALQTPGHPYRAALADAYGEGLRVCALEDVAQIAAPEWGRNAVVVVATIQSFRVEDAGQRNVYSFSESFEPHFRGVDGRALACLQNLPDALVAPEDVARDTTGVLAGFVDQPRWSLANWLALHRPLVIVDEAHNTKTDKSFTALQRLNPSFILELTATPIAAKTNVLYHVSAQELAAEDMIKLPIVLAEHPEGWPAAVFGAVQTQRKLEAEALKDEAEGHGYVRPIVLFQAQNEGDEMPPEKLRDYLVNELKLPASQIVVATGTQRGLEDVHLAARDCPVRFVITVQALREGWDCPFAYVLCSLQKLSSATAVEQLLGRVLRMPHARRRGREALNRAYAHVCAAEFSQAAHALADRLIQHMGFEALDVASMIAPPSALPLWSDLEPNQPAAPVIQAPIATVFEAPSATPELLALPGVQVQTMAGMPQVVVAGHIGQDTEALLLAQVRGAKKQEQVREQVAQHNALVAAQAAPASRGTPFAPLPRLAYRTAAQAPLWPLEREAVLEEVELDLLQPQAVQLPGFHAAQEAELFEIGMQNARVTLRHADSTQMAMDWSTSSIDAPHAGGLAGPVAVQGPRSGGTDTRRATRLPGGGGEPPVAHLRRAAGGAGAGTLSPGARHRIAYRPVAPNGSTAHVPAKGAGPGRWQRLAGGAGLGTPPCVRAGPVSGARGFALQRALPVWQALLPGAGRSEGRRAGVPVRATHRPPPVRAPLGAQPRHGALRLWPAHVARALLRRFCGGVAGRTRGAAGIQGRALDERSLRNRKAPGRRAVGAHQQRSRGVWLAEL
jgi:type III restriction enzyme